MKKIKIVADSSSDLLECDKLDFASASMKIITSEKEFVDDPSLDISEMVTFLEQYKGIPTIAKLCWWLGIKPEVLKEELAEF